MIKEAYFRGSVLRAQCRWVPLYHYRRCDFHSCGCAQVCQRNHTTTTERCQRRRWHRVSSDALSLFKGLQVCLGDQLYKAVDNNGETLISADSQEACKKAAQKATELEVSKTRQGLLVLSRPWAQSASLQLPVFPGFSAVPL